MTPTKKAQNVLRIIDKRRRDQALSRLADARMQEIEIRRDRRRFRVPTDTRPS